MKVYTIEELDAMDTEANLYEWESRELHKEVLELIESVNMVLKHYWHEIPKDGNIFRSYGSLNVYTQKAMDRVIERYAEEKIYLAIVNGTLSIRLDRPF